MKIDGSIDFNLLTSEKSCKLSDKKKLAMMNNVNGNIDNMKNSDSQKPSLIVTNYDEIIGDFGKELEQEIGLIMAEYSFLNEANMSTDELMRLKKMKLLRQSAKVPTSNATSELILAQDSSSNYFNVNDSPSSNSLVELTADRVNIFTTSSSPSHYYPSTRAASKHTQIIQKMRNASECDEPEIYCRPSERMLRADWKTCVNSIAADTTNYNLIDNNNHCYYESIMDDEQHNQV